MRRALELHSSYDDDLNVLARSANDIQVEKNEIAETARFSIKALLLLPVV